MPLKFIECVSQETEKTDSSVPIVGHMKRGNCNMDYTIKEYFRTYFSIEISVQQSDVYWLMFVTGPEIFRELIRIWDSMKETDQTKLKISYWLLSCSSFVDEETVRIDEITFDGQAISTQNSNIANWELAFDGECFKQLCEDEVTSYFRIAVVRIQSMVRGNRLRAYLFNQIFKRKITNGSRFKIIAMFKAMVFEKSRVPLAQPRRVVSPVPACSGPRESIPKSDFPPLAPAPNRRDKTRQSTVDSTNSRQNHARGLPPRPPGSDPKSQGVQPTDSQSNQRRSTESPTSASVAVAAAAAAHTTHGRRRTLVSAAEPVRALPSKAALATVVSTVSPSRSQPEGNSADEAVRHSLQRENGQISTSTTNSAPKPKPKPLSSLTRREVQKLVRQQVIAGITIPEKFLSRGGQHQRHANQDQDNAMDVKAEIEASSMASFLQFFVLDSSHSSTIISKRESRDSQYSSRSSSLLSVVDKKDSERTLVPDISVPIPVPVPVARRSSIVRSIVPDVAVAVPIPIPVARRSSIVKIPKKTFSEMSFTSDVDNSITDFIEEEGTDSSSEEDDVRKQDLDLFPFEKSSFISVKATNPNAPDAPPNNDSSGGKKRLVTKASAYSIISAEKRFSEVFSRLQRVRHLTQEDTDAELRQLRTEEENGVVALQEEEERLLLESRESQSGNSNQLLKKGVDFWNRVRDFGQLIDETTEPAVLEEALTMAMRASVPLLAIQTGMRIITLLKTFSAFDQNRIPLQIIVNTALTFEKDEEVTSIVLDILLNLLLFRENSVDEFQKLKHSLIEFGGCELLLRQLSQNISRFRIVSKVLKVMFLMANNDPEVRLRLGSEASCAVIAEVMTTSLGDAATIDSCLRLIATLCVDCIGNQDRLNKVKICPLVTTAFVTHVKRELSIGGVCEAIFRLCELNHSANQTELGSVAMLAAFSNAFKLHEESPDTVEKLCCGVAALSSKCVLTSLNTIDNFNKSDILEVLLAVVEKPSSTRHARIAAMWAISDLVPVHPNAVVKQKFATKFGSFANDIRLAADKEVSLYVSLTHSMITGTALNESAVMRSRSAFPRKSITTGSFMMRRESFSGGGLGLGSFSMRQNSFSNNNRRLLSRESSFRGSSKNVLEAAGAGSDSFRRRDRTPGLTSPDVPSTSSLDRKQESLLRTRSGYRGEFGAGSM